MYNIFDCDEMLTLTYVIATVEDHGTQREYTVKSKYLIACDGAKSPVRTFLGMEIEGEDSCKCSSMSIAKELCVFSVFADETMMTIHINADLRPIVKRVGMLYWVMDPDVSGFIIAYNLPGNQALICNFDVNI